MDPNQPNGGQPNPGTPYDFIVNPSAPPKRSLIPKIGGGSFIKKLIFIVGGALILIIIMWIVGTIIGGSNISEDDIVGLAQSEQEIARVADKANAASNQTLKNAATTTELTMLTQQQEWLAFLAQRGIEVNDRRLALRQNATTDKTLEDARASNSFDSALAEVLRNYLEEYQAQLRTDFAKASNVSQQELLTKHYQQTVLLLEQLP